MRKNTQIARSLNAFNVETKNNVLMPTELDIMKQNSRWKDIPIAYTA